MSSIVLLDSTFRNSYNGGMSHAFGDAWKIKPFPEPLTTSPHPQWCGCTWAWRPELSPNAGEPFLLKHVYAWCLKHKLEAYEQI